ncbi:MAG: type II toxin-antitoxin system VapC family toxin [Coriobacteriia bacterium]|nr:type II toxin-antitoxin system VapC family toxin [Coriobacteriia bacterium]
MSYMLDTDTCIFAIKKNERVLAAIKAHQDGGLCISDITLSELEYGVCHSQHQAQNRIALTQFLSIIAPLPYEEKAAFEYGVLRADLSRRGCVIGNMNMLIAAHALAAGMTLVTNNTQELARIKRLRLTNWKG